MQQTALITGATSGIGAAFATEYASQGYDLILTGRRTKKIQTFAKSLVTKYNIKAEVIIAELADDKDIDSIVEKIKNTKNLAVLINNAGFTSRGYFHSKELATSISIFKVHDEVAIRLTHAALPQMLQQKHGTIINVSSVMAFIPWAGHAMYASSKSFLNAFSLSLGKELKNTGVKIQVLCPGLTITDFHEKLGSDPKEVYKRKLIYKPMTSEQVVKKSLKYLHKKRTVCVPGFMNKLIQWIFTLKSLLA